jgi:hypothetical protein
MVMRTRLFAIPMMASAIASCGPAKAGTVDVSNPFHCGVAFSVYYGIAKSTGSTGVTMLERRMKDEAIRAAALPASERTRAEGEALSKRLMADPDKAYETVVACMKRQDAEHAGS